MMTTEALLASTDPWHLFETTYADLLKLAILKEPTAMALATADQQGQPSLRTVLLKRHSIQDGFVFFTNYKSRKGQELLSNPRAALLFYWDPLFQQIRIQGTLHKIARQESEDYWNSRPFESQLAGWVSEQSHPVKGDLNEIFETARKQWLPKGAIPCPIHWGGFALEPTSFEFWVGHRHRLHTSVRFERQNQVWAKQVLYP